MSWKCIKFASRSVIESANSANAGSKTLSGNGASWSALFRADSRKDDRDEGRSGVIGRGVRGLETDRFLPSSQPGLMVILRFMRKSIYRMVSLIERLAPLK
jgi:hypothetical protein